MVDTGKFDTSNTNINDRALHRLHYHLVVEFTTTYAINVFHPFPDNIFHTELKVICRFAE
jgi:hypothetical protein